MENKSTMSFVLSNFSTHGVPHVTAEMELVEYKDDVQLQIKVVNESGYEVYQEMLAFSPDMLMINSEERRKNEA